jgi:hypothetical protein
MHCAGSCKYRLSRVGATNCLRNFMLHVCLSEDMSKRETQMKLFSQEFYVCSSANTSYSFVIQKSVLQSTEYVTKRLVKNMYYGCVYILYISFSFFICERIISAVEMCR